MVGFITNEAPELAALRRSRQDSVKRGGNKSLPPIYEPEPNSS